MLVAFLVPILISDIPLKTLYTDSIIATGFLMGLMKGNIMALKWDNFDFSKSILGVQRTILRLQNNPNNGFTSFNFLV